MDGEKNLESYVMVMLGIVALLASILAALMLAGCSEPTAQERGATLSLVFDCPEFAEVTLGERSLKPPAEAMKIKEYTVSGAGPGESSFGPLTSTNGELRLDGLLQGRWRLTAEARSETGAVLANGTATAFLSAATNTTIIILDRLPGTGTLTVSYSWNPTQVKEDVELELQLTDQSGNPTTIAFPTLDRINGTAMVTQTLAAGSYTLHSRLKTQGMIVSGAVEAVRIIDSSVSSGEIQLVVGDRGNGFQITVVNDTLLPLQGTVTCSPTIPGPNTSVTLTFVPATLPAGVLPAEISASWYCEGSLIADATGFSYLCTPRPGIHRYDVVVSHERLGSIGNATIMVDMPYK